jgi:hypothetical protein
MDAASPASDARTNDARDASDANDVDASPGNCAPPLDPQAPIEKLSLTGCRDPTTLQAFTPRAVRYAVNSPGVQAAADSPEGFGRGFVLPDGGKIHVKACATNPSDCPYGAADDGKWVFPVGTVVMQDVGSGPGILETRFLARVADGSWVGYAYQWSGGATTEATLTPDARTPTNRPLGESNAHGLIPSRQDCVTCHNAGGGGTLGLETSQLNLTDSDGGQQLDRIAALGVFDAPLPQPYKAALTAATTDNLAEPPFLHANCSFCHRPGGVYPSFDLRFDTPFAERAICNTPSQVQVSASNNTPVILAPGNPAGSSLVYAGDPWSHVFCAISGACVFTYTGYFGGGQSLPVLSAWVQSITSCP